MRVWTVEGADMTTGISRKVRINAQDEGEAARFARQQGILASSIYVFNPDADDDRLEQLQAAASTATPRTRNPNRSSPSSVTETRRRLNAADFILSIVGWVYIGVGIVGPAAVVAIAMGKPHADAMSLVPQAVVFAICGVSFGILLLGVGAAFRMLGSIGESLAKR